MNWNWAEFLVWNLMLIGIILIILIIATIVLIPILLIKIINKDHQSIKITIEPRKEK